MLYLFDFDGTLLASNQVWEDIDEAFLSHRGIAPVPEDYTEFVCHHGFYESAVYTRERFGLQETAEEIVAIWKEMGRHAYGESLPLKPGAKELLDRLSVEGQRIALLTSCMPELCQLALQRHGLTEYFEAIFTASELGMEKRNPEIYRLTAQRCGVSVQDVVFFDDAPTYCQAAKEVGMTVIGVWDALYSHRQQEMKNICHRYLKELSEY